MIFPMCPDFWDTLYYQVVISKWINANLIKKSWSSFEWNTGLCKCNNIHIHQTSFCVILFLFLKLKIHLKALRIWRIVKDMYGFNQQKIHWFKCVECHGDYFEENLMFHSLFISVLASTALFLILSEHTPYLLNLK